MSGLLMEEIKKEGKEVRTKASGLSNKEMFDSNMAQSGDSVITDCHHLQVDRMREIHAETCETCKWLLTMHEWRRNRTSICGVKMHAEVEWSRDRCYFDKLNRCISHGWKPLIPKPIIPQYEVSGNGANATQHYPGAFRTEVRKAEAAGYIRLTTEQPGDLLR